MIENIWALCCVHNFIGVIKVNIIKSNIWFLETEGSEMDEQVSNFGYLGSSVDES